MAQEVDLIFREHAMIRDFQIRQGAGTGHWSNFVCDIRAGVNGDDSRRCECRGGVDAGDFRVRKQSAQTRRATCPVN